MSSWLHVTALTVYLGSLLGMWLILLPSLAGVEAHETRAKLLARGLRLYNPLQCGALGILVMSGAFQVTALKAAYRELFIRQLGERLAWKLALSFVLIILSTYQFMGVGLRYVRRHDGNEPITALELQTVVARLRASSIAILLVALLASLAGVWLRR